MIYLIETHLEDHNLIHILGFYRWHAPDPRMFLPPRYPPIAVWSKPTSKLPYWKLQYPTYVKDNDHDAHIKIFKKKVKVNGKTMEIDIINLFGFILRDNISKWSENFIRDHPNCTFEELEQTLYKFFWIVNNDKKKSICSWKTSNNKLVNR
jgi:hypothetical protein